MPNKAPDCAECIHHYITHEASFPYGCRALNFKSKLKPCLEVLNASGNPCMAFELRHEKLPKRTSVHRN